MKVNHYLRIPIINRHNLEMDRGISYNYNNLIIELSDDREYTVGRDNSNTYRSLCSTDRSQDSFGSNHGIKLFKDGLELNSCLLTGSGGTTIHPTSAVVDENSLLMCCGDSVFSFALPGLELKWQTHADLSVCFQIFKIENEYLVHGELEISRLNKLGEVIWSFSGYDIFVSADGQESLAIQDDRIVLIDWEKNRYELDFNGKVI